MRCKGCFQGGGMGHLIKFSLLIKEDTNEFVLFFYWSFWYLHVISGTAAAILVVEGH